MQWNGKMSLLSHTLMPFSPSHNFIQILQDHNWTEWVCYKEHLFTFNITLFLKLWSFSLLFHRQTLIKLLLLQMRHQWHTSFTHTSVETCNGTLTHLHLVQLLVTTYLDLCLSIILSLVGEMRLLAFWIVLIAMLGQTTTTYCMYLVLIKVSSMYFLQSKKKIEDCIID